MDSRYYIFALAACSLVIKTYAMEDSARFGRPVVHRHVATPIEAQFYEAPNVQARTLFRRCWEQAAVGLVMGASDFIDTQDTQLTSITLNTLFGCYGFQILRGYNDLHWYTPGNVYTDRAYSKNKRRMAALLSCQLAGYLVGAGLAVACRDSYGKSDNEGPILETILYDQLARCAVIR